MRFPRRQKQLRWLAVLPKDLTGQTPRLHHEPLEATRHRRKVVGTVMLLGTGTLKYSLSTRPGSNRFYASSLATAAIWTGGAAWSGPLRLGWIEMRSGKFRRPIIVPVATATGAFALFYGAALVARRIPVLDNALVKVMEFADDEHSALVLLTTCANGLAEEIFFRGALYDAVGQKSPVVVSTAAYTATTIGTRNPALVIASVVMGGLFGLQRRASGGIQAPALTHLTWSILMVRFLPPLFRRKFQPRA